MACSEPGRRFLLVALLAPLLAAACAAERELPPPAPEAVEPAVGFLTVDVPVLIRGRNFHLRASQGLDGAAEDRVSAQFRAWLGPIELRDATWIDQETLSAVIPANALAQGSHDLVVEGPYGTRGGLAGAYSAIQGTPPDLVLTVDVPPVVTLGEWARILVRVANAGPGAVDRIDVKLRHALNGRGVGGELPGAPVGGGDVPRSLPEGQSLEVEYLITTTAVGTFWYEAKAGGYSPVHEAALPSDKALVGYEVVEAVPPP
jgi:hypothetical protein